MKVVNEVFFNYATNSLVDALAYYLMKTKKPISSKKAVEIIQEMNYVYGTHYDSDMFYDHSVLVGNTPVLSTAYDLFVKRLHEQEFSKVLCRNGDEIYLANENLSEDGLMYSSKASSNIIDIVVNKNLNISS